MEMLSALLAVCEGDPPVSSGFPSQKVSNRCYDVTFDVGMNTLLNKKYSCDLRHHDAHDITVMFINHKHERKMFQILVKGC